MQRWLAMQAAEADRAASDRDAPALRPASLRVDRARSAAFAPDSATGTGQSPRPRPRLPFDDATYALAYEVFLANRNLEDAYEVAAAAVRDRPDDLVWRQRLAQVAEWTSRGAVALEPRHALARASGAPADGARVERLATQLSDGAALLEALRIRARAGGADEALDLRIARLIEEQGRPREALEWLESRIAARGPSRSRQLLDRQLELLQALGDDDAALDAIARAETVTGPDPALAMRRASLLARRGDLAGAFAALHAVRDRAAALPEPPVAEGGDSFWQVYLRRGGRRPRPG
jgi:hypothetical protein